MGLELLVNELLLELFEYFTTADLFHAFYGLNFRFNTLLFMHFRAYGLDFRAISKHDFNIVCRQHLVSMVDRISALHLSDDDDTPGQITLFLSYDFSLGQFTHLRSLSLYHFCSSSIEDYIMLEWYLLPHLSHLKFVKCYFEFSPEGIVRFLNNIWNLSKLTHCYLDIEYRNAYYIVTPTVTSSSLEYLSYLNHSCQFNHLTCLFERTPHLRYLYVNIDSDLNSEMLPSPVLSMNVLKLTYVNLTVIKTNLLESMPNLHLLAVEIGEDELKGDKWEQIIANYLPKLKVFRLRMILDVSEDDDKEHQADQLLDSFRSHFWLEEHQWFVQCLWNSGDNYITLHTLPYGFGLFSSKFPIQSKSTCPYDDGYWTYDRVLALRYDSTISKKLYPRHIFFLDISQFDLKSKVGNLRYEITRSKVQDPPHIRFLNIHQLNVKLPVDDKFWSIVPRLDRLVSLKVTLWEKSDHAYSQLQALLDRIPHRVALTLCCSTWPVQIPSLLETMNQSIRRLDFRSCRYTLYFDSQNCWTLSHSPLGISCEVLTIRVMKRTDILILFNGMTNLRALNVECKEDNYSDRIYASSSTEGELVEWLQHRLPTTCIITRYNTMDGSETAYVQLWIR